MHATDALCRGAEPVLKKEWLSDSEEGGGGGRGIDVGRMEGGGGSSKVEIKIREREKKNRRPKLDKIVPSTATL